MSIYVTKCAIEALRSLILYEIRPFLGDMCNATSVFVSFAHTQFPALTDNTGIEVEGIPGRQGDEYIGTWDR